MSRFAKIATFALPFLLACGAAPEELGTEASAEVAAVESAASTATLYFKADWSEVQVGSIYRGQTVTIQYAPERLTACRGAANTWNIEANVRLQPSGQVIKGNVVKFNSDGTFQPQSYSFYVPTNGTRLEIWFYNYGTGCAGAYDSDYNKNYNFSVTY